MSLTEATQAAASDISVTTVEVVRGLLIWLGEQTLALASAVSYRASQAVQGSGEHAAPGQGVFTDPAMLMVGGLAMLSVLFALMVVRRTPSPSDGYRLPDEDRHRYANPKPTAPPAESDDPAPRDPAPHTSPALPLAEVERMDAQDDPREQTFEPTISNGGTQGAVAVAHPAQPTNQHASAYGAPNQGGLAAREPGHPGVLEQGRRAGRKFDGSSFHDLMEHITESGLGEPRVLQTVPHLIRIRLVHCRGCASPNGEGPHSIHACSFEQGFLEASFEQLYDQDVVVRETDCRKRGGPGCDFEIWI